MYISSEHALPTFTDVAYCDEVVPQSKQSNADEKANENVEILRTNGVSAAKLTLMSWSILAMCKMLIGH